MVRKQKAAGLPVQLIPGVLLNDTSPALPNAVVQSRCPALFGDKVENQVKCVKCVKRRGRDIRREDG